MAKAEDQKAEDINIEYLPDDEGVRVNGKWYASLQRYFKHREDELKKRT